MKNRKCFLVITALIFSSCILPFDKNDTITITIINKTAETVCINTGLSTLFFDGVRKIGAFKTETINVRKETALSAYGDSTGVKYGTRIYHHSGGIWKIT